MKIAVGADHAGFLLKEQLREALTKKGHEVIDRGASSSAESVDYPDFAAAVAQDVVAGRAERGILVCWTGTGMSMAANKVAGIRAGVGACPEAVELMRSHNDANILTLGARFIDAATAERLAEIFLNTAFSGGRHGRRVEKIAALEGTGS